MTSKNIVKVEGLHYKYGDGTYALKGIDLEVKACKTTAILGGNGAGKSTLFLCLNGIFKPASGEIRYKGEPLDYSKSGLKELRRSVGIVFQNSDNQLFSASVVRDISFGVKNLHLPDGEVRRRVKDAMEMTGISQLKDKPTHCLSFGQKKRVAIAGVIAMQPELLILDEPTAGLDPMGVTEIMKLLRSIQKELGLSVIIATHDMDIVPLYCDYAYVMDKGSITLEGEPEELFCRPEEVRRVGLRLPRVGHLMEILKKKDGMDFRGSANTISRARKEILEWGNRLKENGGRGVSC
jgi:cobalt/nickel transport system ATP-binding protein